MRYKHCSFRALKYALPYVLAVHNLCRYVAESGVQIPEFVHHRELPARVLSPPSAQENMKTAS